MTLASVLVMFLFLGMGSAHGWQDQATPAPQGQGSSASQGKTSAGSSAAAGSQKTATAPAKASTSRPKKKAVPDCSTAATATTPATGNGTARKAGPVEQKPCPTPKVVVRNGGSDEPAESLKGDKASPGASAGSTEDLMAAANDNLREISPRELSASQRESVSQIQEFIAQAKAAVAAGDLERGHNLAVKARVLSDELVKP